MPRKLPPYVECWRDRHGKVRVYFRKDKGPRLPLPGPVGSEAFLTAYQEALAGRTPKAPLKRSAAEPGTIEALVQSYYKSGEYAALRETTKVGYRRRMEAIRVQNGHRSVAGLNHGRIVKAFLDPLAGKPGAALDTLKKLRILIRRAIVLGWLTADPSVAIRRPKIGEVRSWTDDEIAQFEAHWPVGSKRRLAFALHLYTGQRRSDVHRMTWADVKGDRIRVVQQKTGAKIDVPLHADLRAILAETPRQHATILNTEYGRPFTVDGFSGFMRDAITAAGLPLDAQPHGLRKAAGRRLAEAGCTAHEIMAVLGHNTLAEAERYTREANRAGLSTGAITKLEGWNRNKNAQTTP
ncbi:Site-specific recombinase XerD [Methylobacterium sp. 275MFSha3.1]|uniref:tyrosine-type recombinase/integrase n=1 Tax=Methylobacterium sp. 275MFSha3.1 TaxID=1502746 RepID=UPI0008A7CD2D|nr:tyrosine-type recombinase/integrase [Methylobacterium sp. 275MFSha3.1]SEH88688.1 Site-specific recombinase XerD [Methylobacterium sp. 275MFSha3.1]